MRKRSAAVLSSGLTGAVAFVACGGTNQAAVNGGLRQACFPNGTCNAGLTCISSVCVDLGDASLGADTGSGADSATSIGADSGSGSGGSGSSGGVDSGSSSGGSGSGSGVDSGSGSGSDAGACGTGEHDCAGACESNLSTSSCGTSCVACPGITNGTATCDGTKCGVACGTGYSLCNGACVDEQSDGNDCGGCGQLCAGTCTSGRCLVALAKGLSNPWDLVVDATNVYWTDFSAPAVTKVAIAGGTPTTLASTGLSHPAWFAKGSSFFIGDGDASSMEWLETLPLGGGAPSTLMQPFSETIDRVAADATYGYWTTGQGGAVVKGAAGGTPLTLVSGLSLAYGIAVDANNVYWSYDFGQNQAAVASMPLAGGTPTTLVSLKNAGAIALDATNVFWADASSGGPSDRCPSPAGPRAPSPVDGPMSTTWPCSGGVSTGLRSWKPGEAASRATCSARPPRGARSRPCSPPPRSSRMPSRWTPRASTGCSAMTRTRAPS